MLGVSLRMTRHSLEAVTEGLTSCPYQPLKDLFHAPSSSLASGAQRPSTVSSLLIVGMLLLCTLWRKYNCKALGPPTTPKLGTLPSWLLNTEWVSLEGVIGNSEAAQLPFTGLTGTQSCLSAAETQQLSINAKRSP